MKTEIARPALLLPALFAATMIVAPHSARAEDVETTGSIAAEEAEAEAPKGLLHILFGRRGAEKPDAEETAARPSRSAAPAHLRPLIHEYAARHGVPPELAEAVVKVESGFNPKARGRAGEIGLMQIKPATARGIGYRGSAKGLYDPETNIAWGMRYLARAYELAGGDTCGAILRYNAGHAAKRMSKGVIRYCAKVKTYVAGL